MGASSSVQALVSDTLVVSQQSRSTGEYEALFDGGNAGDFLYGDPDAADRIAGLGGDDVIYGDSVDPQGVGGEDLLEGGLGSDQVFGGPENDTLYGWDAAFDLETVDDADRLFGNAGNDALYAGSYDDWLDGGIGADWLLGGAGNDVLVGDDDDDDLWGDSSPGLPVFSPFHGRDLASANMIDVADPGRAYDDQLSGGSGNDRLHGELGSDQINGGDGDDSLFGDRLNTPDYQPGMLYRELPGPLHGSDVLFGGAGIDQLSGNGGDDYLDGGADVDLLQGDDDYLDGSFHGNDELHGGTGADLVEGSGGDDLIFGGDGGDQLWGDKHMGAFGGITYSWESGTLPLSGQFHGHDTLFGEGGSDYIDGGGGSDVIDGGEQNDTIYGDGYQALQYDGVSYAPVGETDLDPLWHGDDILYGGGGHDYLIAGGGNDLVYGGTGIDSLYGQAGNDTLSGGAGDDYLFGGAGEDKLRGGTGINYLNGGEGDDLYLFYVGDGNATLVDQSGASTLRFVGVHSIDGLWLGSDELGANWQLHYGSSVIAFDADVYQRIVSIELSSGTFTLEDLRNEPGGPGSDELLGGEADETLDGRGGDDRIIGNGGDDFLIGDLGDDRLYGQFGDDRLVGGPGQDYLYGGEGSDTFVIDAQGGYDVVDANGGSFSDFEVIELHGVAAQTVVVQHGANGVNEGSSYGDLIISFDDSWIEVRGFFWYVRYGEYPIDEIRFDDGTVWTPADVVERLGQATVFDDHLLGETTGGILDGMDGDDWLQALSGSDELIGGRGDDRLDGGTGADTYYYWPGDGSDHFLDGGTDSTEIDRLLLQGGIRPGDLTILNSVSSDLRLALSDGAVLTLSDFYTGEGIEEVHFDDGTVWTADYVEVPANAAPLANPDQVSTSEGQAVALAFNTLLANDSDPDGDPLSIEAVQSPTHGSISVDAQSAELVFTPDPWFIGDAGFEYRVSDGSTSATGWVTVTVLAPAKAILGSDGGEAIAGGRKSDTIYGLGGDDFIDGDRGNDVLIGGLGDDLLVGAKGNDTFVFSAGDGQDLIDNGGGGKRDFDVLQFGAGISDTELLWERIEDSLRISVAGTGDAVMINGWFSDAANQLDEIRTLDSVIEADQVGQLLQSAMVFAAATAVPPVIADEPLEFMTPVAYSESLL